MKKRFVMIFSALMVVIFCLASASALADDGTWERACVDSEFAGPCTEPPFGDNENGLPQPGTVLPIGGTDDSYSRFIIKK